jgi:hypothetical protein
MLQSTYELPFPLLNKSITPQSKTLQYAVLTAPRNNPLKRISVLKGIVPTVLKGMIPGVLKGIVPTVLKGMMTTLL